MRRKLILGTFILASMASLGYQIVWVRLLMQVFGSSVYAISTVLTTFMAGYAVGSFLFGKYVDKSSEPLSIYGIVLLLIGGYGLVTSYGFPLLTKISIFFFAVFKESFIFHEVQFIFAFLILIIPTSLLGGIFPVVNKILVEEKVGAEVGLIYAANNLTAALGSVFTAFVLLPIVGINKTVVLMSLSIIASGVLILSESKT